MGDLIKVKASSLDLSDEGFDSPDGAEETGTTLILERGKEPPLAADGHMWALRGYSAADGSRGTTHACYVLYRRTT